ncbi:hypothetical protein PVA17_18100 [Lysinibacillus sp. CNPSo 3705]|nr:hypothetical protein [Lysinibacillus sp. CNPSo 3705]MDD1504658.1 hypothetical protein [Lysinibacillus sp. CNPSo 3705]
METEWLRTFIVAAKKENFRETAEQREVEVFLAVCHLIYKDVVNN